MQLIKKHFLRLEVLLFAILFIVVLILIYGSTLALLSPYADHGTGGVIYYVIGIHGLFLLKLASNHSMVLVAILLYASLSFFPYYGLKHNRKKVWQVYLHRAFVVVTCLHLLALVELYYALVRGFAVSGA